MGCAAYWTTTVGMIVTDNAAQDITLLCFGIPVGIRLNAEVNNNFAIGHVMLTKTDQQLAPICGAQMDLEFLNYLIEFNRKNGATEKEVLEEYKALTEDDIRACFLFATKALNNTDFMPLAAESI